MKKKLKTKHVDNVVNIIEPFPLAVTNEITNAHNNPIPPVDYYRTKFSTSSRTDKDLVSDETSHS